MRRRSWERQLIDVPGRRPPGRPRKTYRKNMQEELASLTLQEEQALNRDQCQTVIKTISPYENEFKRR